MIIPSTFIRLDYNPSSDVLTVEWPDVHNYTLAEVKESLSEIIKAIRYYDVKRLLIDSRKTVVSIDNEKYTVLSTEFAKEMLQTRLEKLARLESSNIIREGQVQELVKTNNTAAIAFKNFTSSDEALKWLETGIR
ncbi:hypothetical protein [Pontibacter sp. SGAir0037]|uniref:hypothetical protein n=1 Tax=Pontibacter sp. SGAir0037 TaxID=2571030 RepID=UPI0010F5C159|nr:hypothetical protein [Pontibacter sp. SGAir0037]